MKQDYLLKTDGARRLYYEYASELPVIDYHNHVCVDDIINDKSYGSICELWLAPDPYKHRLMRICGVDEHFITGNATPYEKFEKFCAVFPYLAGNPVYDWARMELSFVFGIEDLPTKDNAKYIFDKTGEMLASKEYSANGILSRFGVEYQAPVASILDDLSVFSIKGVAPSLRADSLLTPTKETIVGLSEKSGVNITDEDSYISAVSLMLDRFSASGCRFADHALDAGFFEDDTDGKKSETLVRLACEYANRGWTLLLHIDAKRKTSTRLATLAGAAGGYAGVGGSFPVSKLCDVLNRMEQRGGLPDTVIFPLNMSDTASIAVMQGSFSEDGKASKVQLGPAWWWCDHTLGIKNTLECISSFGVLSQFIGMTTDSRSILSFVRHDYFRRLLCSFVDEKNCTADWSLPFEYQGEIIKKICYENAKSRII